MQIFGANEREYIFLGLYANDILFIANDIYVVTIICVIRALPACTLFAWITLL